MSAHLFGALALLGSAALVAAATGVALFGLARGDRRLGRGAGLVAVVWVVLYAVAVLVSPAITHPRVLSPGEEISFCGLDCHLHVSVAGAGGAEARRAPGRQVVHVRARSDAKRAPEYPAGLRFRLVDESDREYAPEPASDRFSGALAAGESETIALVFAPPAGARDLRLRVTWSALPDRLLLGPANTRAVARTTLALGAPTP
ncbi:MAG TPA: hypothetical protein VFO06_00160 [Gemmatimonadales bacterium]|nr:hypothetical protein [Gemmatimonadales bacterium]